MSQGNEVLVVEQPRELVLLESARHSLAEASTVDEIKSIRDEAEAARNYAKAAKLGLDIQNAAATVKLEAERKAGAVLAAMGKNHGQLRRGSSLEPRDEAATLDELGIGKTESHRWQQEASVPEDEFWEFVEAANENGREITSTALLKYAKQRNTEGQENSPLPQVEDLAPSQFSCIYADPPWPYSNQATRAATDNHYRIEEICEMDVASLSAENCHLHIWTTSSFLRETFAVMDAWGFDYKSSFVWIKPKFGLGNYWRLAHELLCDRSHRNSYVVSLIMWWRPRVHLGRRNGASRLHHIILPPRAAQSRVARVWFGGFVVHRLERRPNCAARRENYVAFPRPPTQHFKAFNATTPHKELDHIRAVAVRQSRSTGLSAKGREELA